jgi:hypothetical protein
MFGHSVVRVRSDISAAGAAESISPSATPVVLREVQGMALYAFDGTWNEKKDNDDLDLKNTNVARFFDAYAKRSGKNDFYVQGVGTRWDIVGKVIGGVFGMGELPRINEAYDRLCTNWAAGDQTIDVIGFSRGAATTLDFCHRVQDKGIRVPGGDEVIEPNPTIRFLGVWDVVAAFGLANLGALDLNIGHHLSLPKSRLQFCFHAMALDERRPSFLPTRLKGAYEVWFRGVHSDVGGGNTNRGLNDIGLKWMMSKARAAGLPIAEEDIAALHPDPTTVPHLDPKLKLKVRLISAVDRRHHTASPMEGCTSAPDTCSVETPEDEQHAKELRDEGLEVLPAEARQRVGVLWAAAKDAGTQLDFPIEGAGDALLTLFQARVPLITTDAQLQQARVAVTRLVATMVHEAQLKNFHALNAFFLTDALFKNFPLFPFTD